MNSSFKIRNGKESDFENVQSLYVAVAAMHGGLARTENEISRDYLKKWINKSLGSGIWLVAVPNEDEENIIGSVHAYKPEPMVFAHILSELTIAVSFSWQRNGVGRALMNKFLDTIKQQHPDTLRVELIVRETNDKAIRFYESLGFVKEGRMEKRIRSVDDGYEADIPMAWLRNQIYKTP